MNSKPVKDPIDSFGEVFESDDVINLDVAFEISQPLDLGQEHLGPIIVIMVPL